MRISDWSSDVCSSDLIRTLVVDYEQKAAARSQEKLIYRHAIHVITAVMMKRLRQRVGAAAVIDAAPILGLLRQPLDERRPHTFDLGRARRSDERRAGKESVSKCRYRWWPAR